MPITGTKQIIEELESLRTEIASVRREVQGGCDAIRITGTLRNRLPCKKVVHGIRGRKGRFPVSEGFTDIRGKMSASI